MYNKTLKFDLPHLKQKERRKKRTFLRVNRDMLNEMNNMVEGYFGRPADKTNSIDYSCNDSDQDIRHANEQAQIREILKKELGKKIKEQESIHERLQKYLNRQKNRNMMLFKKSSGKSIGKCVNIGAKKGRSFIIDPPMIKPKGDMDKILLKMIFTQKKFDRQTNNIIRHIGKVETRVGGFVKSAHNIINKNEKMQNGELEFQLQLKKDMRMHHKLLG